MAGTTLIFDILAKDRASSTFKAFGREIDNLDKKARGLSHFGDIGGKVALGATAGIAAIVGVTANFEKAMSSVKAATGEGEAGMNALRDAALQAGADTAFSASEAAAGIENLAKAGVSVQDILGGGLKGALDLAAAGEIDVAVAAETAASAMTQFGLAGEDVPHIADLLAAAAGKAQGEVTDMAAALNQSGLIADQVGLSIEETTGGLAAFASAGLLGSDAGTSFKTMLGALTPNSAKAATAMEELGISAYDSQGNFIGLAEFAGKLKDGLSTLTDEQRQSTLETIFGSDAVRAAAILYEQGADGIQSWIDKTNDAGFASEQAATKLDNLAGDFEALKGSLETALIGAGADSQGPLRSLTQGLTDVVNAFNNLPGPAKSATTGLLGVTAILGAGVWAASKVVTGIADTRQALSDLGVEAGRTRGLLGGLAKAGAGLAVFEVTTVVLKELTDQLKTPINASTLSRDIEALADGRLTDNLQDVSIWLDDIQDKWERDLNPIALLSPLDMSGFEDAERGLAEIDEALAGLVEGGRADEAAAAYARLGEEAAAAGLSQSDLNRQMKEYKTALGNAGLDAPGAFLRDWAESAGVASEPTKDLAGATDQLGGAAGDAKKEIRGLVDAMQAQRDAALAAFDAETQYREALKAARGQAAKNEAGIKGNSKAALENRDALSGLAAAWNNQSAATRNSTAKFREAKDAFIKTAVAMGVPREAARALARELLAIPKQRVVDIDVKNQQAMSAIQTVKTQLGGIDQYIPITLHVQRTGDGVGGLPFGSGGQVKRTVGDAPELGRDSVVGALLRNGGMKAFQGIGRGIVASLVQGVNGTEKQAERAVERMMKAIAKALKDDKITKAAAERMRATVQAMAREGDKLRSVLAERLDFSKQLRSGFSGEMDLGSLVSAEGGFGGLGSLTGGYQGLATRLRAFAGQLKELRQEGIPRGLIGEIAALGSDQGSTVAASILAGSKGEQNALSSAYSAFQNAAGMAATAGADARFGTVREIKQENHVTLNVTLPRGVSGEEFGREATRSIHKELLKLKRELGAPLGLT